MDANTESKQLANDQKSAANNQSGESPEQTQNACTDSDKAKLIPTEPVNEDTLDVDNVAPDAEETVVFDYDEFDQNLDANQRTGEEAKDQPEPEKSQPVGEASNPSQEASDLLASEQTASEKDQSETHLEPPKNQPEAPGSANG